MNRAVPVDTWRNVDFLPAIEVFGEGVFIRFDEAKVSAWCDEQGVLPESLTLGQRTLEDVFLQITGRELVV